MTRRKRIFVATDFFASIPFTIAIGLDNVSTQSDGNWLEPHHE